MTPAKLFLPALITAGAILGAPSLSASPVLSYYLGAHTDGSGATVPRQPGDQIATPATTVANGLVAHDIVRGDGISPTNLVNAKASNNWNNINANTPEGDRINPTRENAILFNNFYEFGFTVQPGFTASLSTLNTSIRRTAIDAPMFFEWQYSFDGFATDGTTIAPQGSVWDDLEWTEPYFTYFGRSAGTAHAFDPYQYMTSQVDGQGDGNPMPTMDLTGVLGLQDIQGGTTVTFRLYAWAGDGNTGTANTNSIALGRFDGPELGGIVIPEPSTYALLFGLGTLGALVFRRRLTKS